MYDILTSSELRCLSCPKSMCSPLCQYLVSSQRVFTQGYPFGFHQPKAGPHKAPTMSGTHQGAARKVKACVKTQGHPFSSMPGTRKKPNARENISKFFFHALSIQIPKPSLGLTRLLLSNPLMLPQYDTEIMAKTKQPCLLMRDLSLSPCCSSPRGSSTFQAVRDSMMGQGKARDPKRRK